jgi:peptidoglycan/LPS O-acetylase OafA/YrhL
MLYNIEFLRVILCIAILLSHSGTEAKNPFMFEIRNKYFVFGGSMGVQFFFTVGGYFLFFQSLKKDLTLRDFLIKRYVRLMPVIIFSMLMILVYRGLGLVSQRFRFPENFLNLFFIKAMGLHNHTKTHDFIYANPLFWYLGPFFWTSLFYFLISKNFDRGKTNLLIAVITYISFLAWENLTAQSVVFSPSRSLSGMGLGYFVGVLVDYCSNCEKIERAGGHRNDHGTFYVLMMTCLEIFFLVIIFKTLFTKPKIWEGCEFYYNVCFAVLLFLFSLKVGWLSRLLDHRIMGFFGRYCYSTYVTQYLVQILLVKDNRIGENIKYVNFTRIHPIAVIVINYVLLEIMVGIVVYHLIEKPCAKYFEKKFLNG